MGKKSLANKSKGKRPIIEDYDSDFDAPMPKRGRHHSSKKTKLNLEEHTVPEISGKKTSASAEDRTQVGFKFHSRFPLFQHLHFPQIFAFFFLFILLCVILAFHLNISFYVV